MNTATHAATLNCGTHAAWNTAMHATTSTNVAGMQPGCRRRVRPDTAIEHQGSEFLLVNRLEELLPDLVQLGCGREPSTG